MKKIVIFLSILFSLISSQEIKEYVPQTERMVAEEINVLISPQLYQEIIAEIVNVISKIYDELSKNSEEGLLKFSTLNKVITIILKNMPTTFEIFDLKSQDLLLLARNLTSISRQNLINKNVVIDLLKARFIQFLSHYGFPEDEQPFITLDSKIKNGINEVAYNIIQNCSQIQLYQDYKSCVVIQFKYLYRLLPFSLIIEDSNLFNEITEISYQQTIDLNIVKNNIIVKITDFLDNIFSKDTKIANQMEPEFRLIKNQCLGLSNRIIKECVSPHIETIYALIPFDLVETSDWVINEFMTKLVSSDYKFDMLIKIFLKLKIQSSNNNTLRLLTDNPENYGVTICKWFISLFSLSDELCD